jgi:hypothetical protein
MAYGCKNYAALTLAALQKTAVGVVRTIMWQRSITIGENTLSTHVEASVRGECISSANHAAVVALGTNKNYCVHIPPSVND